MSQEASAVTKRIWRLALLGLFLGGLALLYFLFNPSDHSFFLPCPFQYATGYHCPGCGSQRAIHQLLHGNIGTAFWINPLLVLTIPILIYAMVLRAWNYVYQTKYRVWFFYSKWFIYGYFGFAIVYWVIRNLPYYPFNLLAPDVIP